MHMDGARLFNAAIAKGVAASAFVATVDSVWIDFTKGLGAPIGAVLALKVGIKLVSGIGLLAMALGLVIVGLTGTPDASYFGWILISMVFLALGLSFNTAPATEAVMSALTPHVSREGCESALRIADYSTVRGGCVGFLLLFFFFWPLLGHLLPSEDRPSWSSPGLASLPSPGSTLRYHFGSLASLSFASSFCCCLTAAASELLHQAALLCFQQPLSCSCTA